MPMNEAANTRLSHELFERFRANDVDGVMDLLADDVMWRFPASRS